MWQRKVSTLVLASFTVLSLGTLSVNADTTTTTSSNSNSSTASSSGSTSSSSLNSKFKLPGNPKLVKSEKTARGDTITFDNFFQVTNETNLTKLELVDPLNNSFEFSSAKVLQSDTSGTEEVTKTGKLQFDNSTHSVHWTADKPADYFGQKLDLQVTVKVDKNTNLSEIPNQSYMLVNGEKVPTDQVKVTLDQKTTPQPESPKPPVATPAPKGSLPQTMQKIAQHYWPAIVAGLAMIGGAGWYFIRNLKKKGESANDEK